MSSLRLMNNVVKRTREPTIKSRTIYERRSSEELKWLKFEEHEGLCPLIFHEEKREKVIGGNIAHFVLIWFPSENANYRR